MDEYTYAQYLDRETYMSRMVNHWDTFYTEQDFQRLYDCKFTYRVFIKNCGFSFIYLYPNPLSVQSLLLAGLFLNDQ